MMVLVGRRLIGYCQCIYPAKVGQRVNPVCLSEIGWMSLGACPLDQNSDCNRTLFTESTSSLPQGTKHLVLRCVHADAKQRPTLAEVEAFS